MNAPARLFLAVCPLVVFFSFISFLSVFDMIECHRLWLSRPSASLSHSPKAVVFFLAALERAGGRVWTAATPVRAHLDPSLSLAVLLLPHITSFLLHRKKKHRKRQGGREKTKEKEASQGSCCCCSNYSENIMSGNVVNTWALLVNHNN